MTDARFAMTLLWEASPLWFMVTSVTSLLLAAIPGATLVFQRQITDRIDQGRIAGNWWWAPVAALVICLVADDVLDNILSLASRSLEDHVKVTADRRLVDRMAALSGTYLHETPAYRDRLDRAVDGTQGFRTLAWAAFGVPARIIGTIPVITILGTQVWWLPLMIVASLVPMTWLMVSAPIKEWDLMGQPSRTRSPSVDVA